MNPELARIEQELADLEQFLATRDASRVGEIPTWYQQRRDELRAQRAALLHVEGNMQGSQIVGGDQNISHSGDGHLFVLGPGATVSVTSSAPAVEVPAVRADSALAAYLKHLIADTRFLQLEGIGARGNLVSVELEQVYITLRATRQRTAPDEETWLAAEARLAPGEEHRALRESLVPETVTVTVNEALAAHRRLVVLGDPGSGKTTLLRYLALRYARALAEGTSLMEALGLDEAGTLPILVPLRGVGGFLRAHHAAEDGTEGHARLLAFLVSRLAEARVALPPTFFDPYLESGRALLLFDGLDEVADPVLRQRVARLVESFTLHYPDCRAVVTSRKLGYEGAARLQAGYATTTVRDFTLAEVERFLHAWHRVEARSEHGPGEIAERYATLQTKQLMEAIRHNERVRDLAINPLMLTIIALIHRDQVKLPDRRAALYGKALEVMLGGRDAAHQIAAPPIFPGRVLEVDDKLDILQGVALAMHEQGQKEMDAEALRALLRTRFRQILDDTQAVERAITPFLTQIAERSGLLLERGQGVYGFSHLTFQEYLAARAIAARTDYIGYSVARAALPGAWWHEVIRLEAGYLATQGRERVQRLIHALMGCQPAPDAEPFQGLVLAAECLRDVGENLLPATLATEIRSRLYGELEEPIPENRFATLWLRLTRRLTPEAMMARRRAAVHALAKISTERYWSLPYGEPEWVHIPAGLFWMGSDDNDPDGFPDEKPLHHLHLDDYWIARVPITNAQYLLFVEATGCEPPEYWEDKRPPRGEENHPVVNTSWEDALAYCRWLSGCIGKPVTLPSEAEWEKAARGALDKRRYPWGDDFDPTRCNTDELGLGDTTPVGIFPAGASPYGALDMAGNMWEWTRSAWGNVETPRFSAYPEPARYRYPYRVDDGREAIALHKIPRVLRGGSFAPSRRAARCAYRGWQHPLARAVDCGFRVAVSP